MGDRRVKLSPSLMCADPLSLGREVDELVELGVDYLHLDIMDGHYVPNLTLGTDLARVLSARYATQLDIHLMVDEPDRWARVFVEKVIAGAESARPGSLAAPVVTIHPETTWHPARTLVAIAEAGGIPALAIDPARQPAEFENLLELVGLVLVMTVNPGYAGQRLVSWTLGSVEWLAAARERRGLAYEIEVDGNVSWENIPRMIAAGGDVLVVGTSSLFDRSMSRSEAHARVRTLAIR